MNNYQDQINRMWGLIKLQNKALKNGFWIEAIEIGYILLEIEFRLLLRSRADSKKGPIDIEKINNQKYLINLATLALDNNFISNDTFNKIKSFNVTRKKAFHGLAFGEIEYADIEDDARKVHRLIGEIQGYFLTIKVGKIQKQRK